jgi:hypothetical protein
VSLRRGGALTQGDYGQPSADEKKRGFGAASEEKREREFITGELTRHHDG